MFRSGVKLVEKPVNVGILFSDFGPYHVTRIEALAASLNFQDSNLFAFRFSEYSTTYKWTPVLPQSVSVVTLADKQPSGILEALKIATRFKRALRKKKIEVVFLPSYSPLANMLCLFSAKIAGCKAILMCDSWHETEKKKAFSYLAKHFLIRLFNSALVAGTPHVIYACYYGQKISKVFMGYDVIDVNYYSKESKRWRNLKIGELPVSNLPARYFLNLGRFIPKKNIAVLVTAYAQLVQRNPSICVALVLVGEGPEEQNIKKLASQLRIPVRDGLNADSKSAIGPEIVVYPFQQIDRTPLFFGRCEAFLLPSLYEEWGLVINEAMASGAAVLVSEKAGCASDLVIDGKSGFRFSPSDPDKLSYLLEKFIINPGLSKDLGSYGEKLISKWGPEFFVDSALKSINSAQN